MSHEARSPQHMSAARWSVLEPMLDLALDTPTDDRLTYLRAACGHDTALLAELLSLLKGSESPDAELDAGAGALVPDLLASVAPRTLDVPDMLAGRYRIIRELGQGGMAVVFLAEDDRLKRRVAIKVLRRDIRPRRGGDRFNAEIRLTANLRHPNIVPLFESGDADGWTFFVMPYIEGESLMQRLARDGALETHDATRIITDIAGALAHAHRAGVVHRDVKPSNIMLADGQALLVDFGIARAARGPDELFTQPGFAVGTPAYMSPEQCMGDDTAGPASDIYSLGAVLHELLAGQAPPAAAIRLAQAAPGVTPRRVRRTIEPALPVALATVVERAMRLEPGERFKNAEEFSAAVTVASSGVPSKSVIANNQSVPRAGHFMRWLIGSGLLLVATAGIVVALQGKPAPFAQRFGRPKHVGTVTGDTSRILLLPLAYDASVPQRLDRHDPLRAAFARWAGVTVVDATQAREAIAATGIPDTALTTAAAFGVARAVNAGRYLRRDLAVRGSQTFLHATLYETGSARVVSEATVNLGVGIDTTDAAFRELADQLLLAGVPGGLRSGAFVGTTSRPALQQFARGVGAVDRWDLAAADSALTRAVSYDSAFARAELWLAQVRVWQKRPEEAWTYLVSRAELRRASLVRRDQHALDALLAQASGDTKRACAMWLRLAEIEVSDFSAWYGAATCELADNAIVRDRRSASGWRFRSSVHHASAAFRRAFQILPAVHREFRASWYAELDGRLLTSPTQVRLGFAVRPDTGTFLAYPSWDALGDSLTFVPYRMNDFTAGKQEVFPTSHREAVRQQRELMRRIATTWRAAFPASADAMLAVAVSLDKLGDPTAQDSLVLASRLAVSADERLRIGIARVWLLVKYGVPDNLSALRAARVLADSLLLANPDPSTETSEAMASIAMLTGRATLAVRLARNGRETVDRSTPAFLKQIASALQIFAAIGAEPDSLARLESLVSNGIALSVAAGAQGGARERLLGRAATLAYPRYESPMLAILARSGDELAIAQAAWSRADTTEMVRALLALEKSRRVLPPEDQKFETLLPEAALLRASGDDRGALARVAPTLDAQNRAELVAMRTPIGAALLVRSIGMRAELAARLGDRRLAGRWARAYMALWGEAEPLLRPQVRRVSPLVGY